MVLLDMKIPKNCWDCPMQRYAVRSDNHICVITGKLAEEIEERSALCPIKTEIPKDATNGDLLLSIFQEKSDCFYPIGTDKMGFAVDVEWWNSPWRG
jgi:hypothetical protein